MSQEHEPVSEQPQTPQQPTPPAQHPGQPTQPTQYPGQPTQGYYPQGYPPQGYPPPGYPPPGYYGGPPLPHRTTNGLAIASLVLGIMWMYWLGSILALVFGYMARKQIRERDQNGAGMATAGIVLGWVGIGSLVLVAVFATIATVVDSSSTY